MINSIKKKFARFPYSMNKIEPIEKYILPNKRFNFDNQLLIINKLIKDEKYFYCFEKLRENFEDLKNSKNINISEIIILNEKMLKMAFYTRKYEDFEIIEQNLKNLKVEKNSLENIFFKLNLYKKFTKESTIEKKENLLSDDILNNNKYFLLKNIDLLISDCKLEKNYYFHLNEIKMNLKSCYYPIHLMNDYNEFLSHLNNFIFFVYLNKKKFTKKNFDQLIFEESQIIDNKNNFVNISEKLNHLILKEKIFEMFLAILQQKFLFNFNKIFEQNNFSIKTEDFEVKKTSDYFIILNFIDMILDSDIFYENGKILLNQVFLKIQQNKKTNIFKTRIWFLYGKYFLKNKKNLEAKKLFLKILNNEFKPYDSGIIISTYNILLNKIYRKKDINRKKFLKKYKNSIENCYYIDLKENNEGLQNLFTDLFFELDN